MPRVSIFWAPLERLRKRLRGPVLEVVGLGYAGAPRALRRQLDLVLVGQRLGDLLVVLIELLALVVVLVLLGGRRVADVLDLLVLAVDVGVVERRDLHVGRTHHRLHLRSRARQALGDRGAPHALGGVRDALAAPAGSRRLSGR